MLKAGESQGGNRSRAVNSESSGQEGKSCLTRKDVFLPYMGRQREAGQGSCLPGGPSPTLGAPALPQDHPRFLDVQAHFPSETPRPSEWKSLQAPTPGHSCAVPMPLPGADGKSCCLSLSHSCDSQWLPNGALGKIKAPKGVSDGAAEAC